MASAAGLSLSSGVRTWNLLMDDRRPLLYAIFFFFFLPFSSFLFSKYGDILLTLKVHPPFILTVSLFVLRNYPIVEMKKKKNNNNKKKNKTKQKKTKKKKPC